MTRRRFGSDVVVDLLVDLDISYVALNPGATFRGLHDSLVFRGPPRGDGPEIVMALHEQIAVAVAHGYAKAAGKPMAVALHDVVGLQHASMAIYNAWCDRVPVLVLGGTGPMDASRRRPWIDWIHTANVQATQVRDYTKWDDQPASVAAVPESVIRAVQIARAAPPGPTYVCLDSDLQEAEVHDLVVPSARGFAPPTAPAPEPSVVDTIAGWLVEASSPVIVSDLVGRSEVAFDLLVELADLLAVAVVDPEREYNKVSCNFPTAHPMNQSGREAELVASADVVIGLEVLDLFATSAARSGARVGLVGVDHLAPSAWSQDLQRLTPCTARVTSTAASFLAALLPRIRARWSERDPAGIAARRAHLTESHAAMRATWRRAATARASSPIDPAYLALVCDEVCAGERVVANGSLHNWVHRLWSLARPGDYLGGSGGAGLGYGLGASVGTALAHRDTHRLVIDFQSDGDALYTPQALWTAAHHTLPLLVVVDSNRSYQNSVEHNGLIARERGRPHHSALVGTTIDCPPVDFSGLARSFGVWAEGPVSDPDRLGDAVERAVRIVCEERRPALVEVLTAPRSRAVV